jgi:peptidoglycan/LPS O-acetylase OafA/YrhL
MFLKIFIYPYLISHGYASYWRRGIDYSGGFIAGALLALFKVEKVNCKSTLLFIAILIWVVSILFHFYIWMQYFVWPLAVVIIGTSATGVIKNIKSRIGDLSYGIYIYAFPIQQTLEHFFKLSYIPLMFLGVIITLPFAFFS